MVGFILWWVKINQLFEVRNSKWLLLHKIAFTE